MCLPEFTAEASLGKTSERHVLTSEHTAGAPTRSLQPQLHTRFVRPECTLALIDCFLFNQCYYYNHTACPPPRPRGQVVGEETAAPGRPRPRVNARSGGDIGSACRQGAVNYGGYFSHWAGSRKAGPDPSELRTPVLSREVLRARDRRRRVSVLGHEVVAVFTTLNISTNRRYQMSRVRHPFAACGEKGGSRRWM